MNVQIEPKPDCVAMLHVELPSETVSEAWDEVAGEFQRHVRIPGFRPGKAPRSVVDSRYGREIRKELEQKLVSDAIRDAIKERSLRVLHVQKVNQIEIADDRSMRFTATLVLSPDFSLPDYSSVEVELEEPTIGNTEVDAMLERMRDQYADFEDIEGRGAAVDDFAILDYSATLDGQPLEEALPSAPKVLRGGRNSWFQLREGAMIKGFTEALEGAKPAEEREFSLEVPADFPVEELRGRQLGFRVKVNALKSRVLPPIDDELAKKMMIGESIDEARRFIEENLRAASEREFESRKRQAALGKLLGGLEFEIPASMLRREMRGIISDIVRDNQARGISEDEMRQHEQEILGVAQSNAKDRVKANFFLLRVAENEKLKVSEEELVERVSAMADRMDVSFDKMVKDLRKRDAIGLIEEQILCRKALDLVASNVTVRPPSQAANPAQG